VDVIALAGRNGFLTIAGANAFSLLDEMRREKAEGASQTPPLLVLWLCNVISA
jgi:hypothetical protein